MQAKISYSVDLEQIPEEVGNVLKNALNKLKEFSQVEFNPTKENVIETAVSLSSLRKSLVDIDQRLGDCYSILVEFNKILAQGLEPQKSQQDEVNDDTRQPVSE